MSLKVGSWRNVERDGPAAGSRRGVEVACGCGSFFVVASSDDGGSVRPGRWTSISTMAEVEDDASSTDSADADRRPSGTWTPIAASLDEAADPLLSDSRLSSNFGPRTKRIDVDDGASTSMPAPVESSDGAASPLLAAPWLPLNFPPTTKRPADARPSSTSVGGPTVEKAGSAKASEEVPSTAVLN